MSFSFLPARRENVPLLIGIAGPSGSGKTLSALKIAKGLSGGQPFAVIDTERGRALHYADDFAFLHANLDAPFTPARYAEAIAAAQALDASVTVVDSFSHEHAGEGGVLDMHEAELQRMAGDDWKKREAVNFAAWVRPKAEHKRLMQKLLQLDRHLIVCLRGEEKVDLVKNPETGKVEVKPKRTLAGHVGWIPVIGKDVPYELTISLVVTPDRPGVPQPIKLQEQHRPLIPLDRPLEESVGVRLREWAAGGALAEAGSGRAPASASDDRPAGAVIDQADRRRLFATARETEGGEDRLRALVKEMTGSDSTAGMTVGVFRELLAKMASPESTGASGSEAATVEGNDGPDSSGDAEDTLFKAPAIREDPDTGEQRVA